MSDDVQAGVRRTNLIAALSRGFARLDQGDREKIADELLLGKVSFGANPVVIARNFDPEDPILAAFLEPMGDWKPTLLESLEAVDKVRKLRWSPEHQFLYVTAA